MPDPLPAERDGTAAAAPETNTTVPAELPDKYFDLYNLTVEMADRVSARRAVANSFFLTINTGVLALLGSIHSRWYPAGAGIILCIVWWALLLSYRDLNRAKFSVILAMETRLPAQVFGDEWEQLSRPPATAEVKHPAFFSRLGHYRELGYLERVVPWVFVVMYVVYIAQDLAR